MTESTEGQTPPPLDLRVARIVEAREHPNADRLLLLQVDLGTEQRQLVAGVAGQYEADQLVAKDIVVVTNLQPARLRGELSEGMLLAGQQGETIGLLTASGAEPGTRLTTAGAAEPAGEITFQDFQKHTLEASPDGVTLDGEPLTGAELKVEKEVFGKLL